MIDKVTDTAAPEMDAEAAALLARRVRMMMVIAGLTTAIGNRTPGLKTNDDGSFDLWIGHDDPGEGRRANWLPAPSGPFTMTLRAYLPGRALLNGDYKLPPMTQTS